MSVNRKMVVAVLAVLSFPVLFMGNSGCNDSSTNSQALSQSLQGVNQRAQTFQRAEDLYPAPDQQNFPLRKALVTLTKREDQLNHPWYVYLQSQMTGQPIAYYVSQTEPQSECNTLSSTQAIVRDPNHPDGQQSMYLTEPTLNGVYGGGAGAVGSCDVYFFQDVTTGAEILIHGNSFFVTDQPLALNVPRLKISSK